MTIIIILGFVISFFLLLYLVWYRSSHENNEKLFDIAIISFIVSIILSRIAYMVAHFSEYNSNGWSIFPFYLEENQRVWFKNLPWNFFKFDDGILFVTLPLFVLMGSLIYLYLIKDKNIFKNIIVIYSSFVLVFMVLTLLSVFNYLGNELNLNYSELIKLTIILGIFIFGVIIFIYFSRKKDIQLFELSIQSLVLSFFVAGTYLLILNDNKSYKDSYTISLIYIIISILSYLIYTRQKKTEKQKIVRVVGQESEDGGMNRQDNANGKKYGSYRISYSTIASEKSYLQRIIDSAILKYYKLTRKSGKRENG